MDFFRTVWGKRLLDYQVPSFVQNFGKLTGTLESLVDVIRGNLSLYVAFQPDDYGVRIFSNEDAAEAFMEDGAVDEGWTLMRGLVVETEYEPEQTVCVVTDYDTLVTRVFTDEEAAQGWIDKFREDAELGVETLEVEKSS